MELNTVSLPDFVKLANIIFLKGADSVNSVALTSGLFINEPFPQNTGNTREYTEIDLQEYALLKRQGDQAQRAKVQQGYTKTLTLYRVGLDIGITYEMRTQNKYTEVIRKLTNLGQTPMRRLDLDLTHRITFGTATTYTDMDGESKDISVGDALALFSTVHKIRGSSTTYRNRLASNPQLSKGAIEGMERLVVEETINQFGEKVVVPFDIIFYADDPNTENTLMEYLRSTASPDGINAGVVNVYRGKYRAVKLPRLATDKYGNVDSTKRKYWGLASSSMTSAYVAIHEPARLLPPPTAGNNGEERSSEDWNFGARMGYGICIVSGAWIKFSSGDGTA